MCRFVVNAIRMNGNVLFALIESRDEKSRVFQAE